MRIYRQALALFSLYTLHLWEGRKSSISFLKTVESLTATGGHTRFLPVSFVGRLNAGSLFIASLACRSLDSYPVRSSNLAQQSPAGFIGSNDSIHRTSSVMVVYGVHPTQGRTGRRKGESIPRAFTSPVAGVPLARPRRLRVGLTVSTAFAGSFLGVGLIGSSPILWTGARDALH